MDQVETTQPQALETLPEGDAPLSVQEEQQQQQPSDVPQEQPETAEPVVEPVAAQEQLAAAAIPVKEQEKIDPVMLFKDVFIKPTVPVPEDIEVTKAKAFLKTSSSSEDGQSLYDHLASVVMRVLETRPSNALKSFEKLSAQTKRARFQVPSGEAVRAAKRDEKKTERATKLLTLAEEVSRIDSDDIGDVPDVLELSRLWEWAGVSLGASDTFHLFLELKKLVKDENLKSVRVWGKILGIKKNYFIVEADTGEEPVDPLDEPEPQTSQETEGEEQDPLPKPKVAPKPRLTPESHSGANRYAYFVTNAIGEKWTRLPDALPEKIQVSRQIQQLFTGDLSHKVVSYPPFNDNEAQLLRCQIARISASTVVAPANYYIPDPEVTDEEAGNGPKPLIINPEYESTPNELFLNLDNWVHHTPYLLPQGRVVWQNPFPKKEGEEGEEETKQEQEEVEPEESKEALLALSQDEDHGNVPSWNVYVAAKYLSSKQAPVVLKSLRWPGATSIVHNDKFTNIYIGYGLKDAPAQKQSWPQLPEIQKEWVPEAEDEEQAEKLELKEQIDPTVEEEEAYEDSLQEKKEMEEDEEKEEEQ